MGMRWLRLRLGTLTYEDWLLFCFTAGIFCGTAAALAFGGPTVQGCIPVSYTHLTLPTIA